MFGGPLPKRKVNMRKALMASREHVETHELFESLLRQTDQVPQRPEDLDSNYFAEKKNMSQETRFFSDRFSQCSRNTQCWERLNGDQQAPQEQVACQNVKVMRQPQTQYKKLFHNIHSDVFRSFVKHKKRLNQTSQRIIKAAKHHGADVKDVVAYMPKEKKGANGEPNYFYGVNDVEEFLIPKEQSQRAIQYATIELMVVFLQQDYPQVVQESKAMKEQFKLYHIQVANEIQAKYERYVPYVIVNAFWF